MSAQKWDPEHYGTHARYVSELGESALERLRVVPGERVLDLGCGDGALTERLVQAGAEVVGVDRSAAMVEAACRRGLDARVMDAHALTFSAEFDAVFSNAALHWMRPPDPVLRGVRRALRPGGRFGGEFGGHGNVAAISTALRAVLRAREIPFADDLGWYFPTTAEFARALERQELEPEDVQLIPRPTPLPTGMEGWLKTFVQGPFQALSAEAQAEARGEMVALLKPALCDTDGRWTADYVRLRFVARCPT